MGHSYWSLGPVCWKHSSQSACSSSQSSCSSSLETVFSLPSIRSRISKGFAIFSVFLFFNFSVLRQGVDPRVQRTHFFTALGVVWRQIRGAGIHRKSDFSDTFELGRDAYREIVEQSLSRSSDSTKFSSSCNQVRRQRFCHCTEAPSSGSSVQSVYRLGLLW